MIQIREGNTVYFEPDHSINALYKSIYRIIGTSEGSISPMEAKTIKNLTQSILNLEESRQN